MPPSMGLDDRGRIGKVIKPRQIQYVNVQEGSPFPTIMHHASMSSFAGIAELHRTAQRQRGTVHNMNASSAASARFLSGSNDISDMHAQMLGSVTTPMAYDVSGVNIGRKTAHQLEEEKKPQKPNFGRRERLDTAAAIGAKLSQTEKLMGRQTGEYARRRAEQLEQFRGTPEPGITNYGKIQAAQQQRLSKGSAASMKTTRNTVSYSDSREEALLATFLPPHRATQPMQGWKTPVPEDSSFSGFPKMREYSPPPGHMAFNPRSMSPLRDTVMHSSAGPIGWGPDEQTSSSSPAPPAEFQRRDNRKDMLLKGIDVDILPSDLRQHRTLRMIPRSNPIVQEEEEEHNAVILMPLPSAPPFGKGRSSSSNSFYHPQHKLPERREKKISLPPASFERSASNMTNVNMLSKKSSMKKINSIRNLLGGDSSVDDEKSILRKPSSARSTRSIARSPEQERKHEGGKQAKPDPPKSRKSPPKPSRQVEKKAARNQELQPLSKMPTRSKRQRYLGGALSKTAEHVLDKLEDAQEQMEALKKEIAAENARIRAERGQEAGANPEMVQKNIDKCAVRADRQARLQEKMQHFERVRQRAKELKRQALEDKIYSTKRAERLQEAAAQRRFMLEEEDRVKTLAPIFAIISTLSGLGDQINARRALVEHKQLKLWAVITMQRIFRGFKARREYNKVLNAVLFLQKAWRIQFVWRIKLLKQVAATRVLQFIREVHNQSDFIGAMKVAIHRIVKESRKKSQMKTLSRGIMTTVLRGQWSKAEIKEINRKKEIERVKKSRFMAALAAAVEKEQQSPETAQAAPAAAPPPTGETSAPSGGAGAFGKLGGKGKLKGMVKKNMKKMRSLVGQSMPNASTVMDDLTPIPDLVKLLVVEAFINLREEQYVRVMGVYWLQKSRYFRKRRAYERSQARMTQGQGPNSRATTARGGSSHAPIPPKLYPMPRGSRAPELKVMMQQGVYELTIMEQEDCWDLKEKRQLSEGETSLLSDKEKERIPAVQERLKKRLFMCNISVKANLMTPYQGNHDEHHEYADEHHDD